MSKYERSLRELENIGDSVLKKFNTKNPSCEVNIEYIIEQGYNIIIEALTLKIEVPTIEAFPCLDANKIYVDIGTLDSTSESQERRYRFTLAEELSHIILHRDIYKSVKNIDDYLRIEKSMPNEEYSRLHNNARTLAGIILMPRYPFINRAVEIRDSLIKSTGKKAEDLTDEKKGLLRLRIVKTLMDDFNVNQKPVEIRLERTEKYLRIPLFSMTLRKSYLKRK